ALEKAGALAVEADGRAFEVSAAEVEITTQDVGGSGVASEDGITAALDITIDGQLRAEGLAREVIKRTQNMRKEQGLNVGDRIGVLINAPQDVKLAIESNIDYICSETLSDALTFTQTEA